MMYAGSKNSLVKEGQFTKVRSFLFVDLLFYPEKQVFELRAVDEMTEEWLLSKLGFFR